MRVAMKKWILLFTTFGMFAAHGEVQSLATITNDRNTDKSTLEIIVANNGDVEGLSFVTVEGKTGKVKHLDFSISKVESQDGVVLEHDSGYDVFLLKGKFDDRTGTGVLSVKFLTVAPLHKYYVCGGMKLRRDANQKWSLSSSAGAKITNAKIITSATGIWTVKNVCPADA